MLKNVNSSFPIFQQVCQLFHSMSVSKSLTRYTTPMLKDNPLTDFLHSDSGTWNFKLALKGVESGRFGEGGVVCAHWAEAEN